MRKKKLNIGLLKDAPILRSEKEYYDFYHNYISPALHEIIQNSAGLFTIGLFSPWGSGKSTIIENLAKDYGSQYPVFVFDVWKYKGDPLRRTFLITLRRFLEKKELWKKDSALSEEDLDEILNVSQSVQQEIEISSEKGAKIGIVGRVKELLLYAWNIYTKNMLWFGMIVLGFSWLILQLKLGEANSFIHSTLLIVGYIGQSSSYATVLGWVAKTLVEKLSEKLAADLTNETKTQTLIKRRDFLNSPEQFESKFIDIMNRIKGNLVVVFDNIDRVPGDVAIDILASIKTFLDVKPKNKVIFIIPCDSLAIEEQIKKYYQGSTNENFEPSEYLRKIFNIVLTAPDFISTDIEDYAMKKVSQLDNNTGIFKGQEDNLLRVVTYAFKSPRAIKQFLNNFAATLLVAYNSDPDVWVELSQNIPYLAKVQIIRQRFPDEYRRLKEEKLFDPENIEGSKSKEDFRNFMRSTSTITVDNAKPYIYFKVSNSEKNVIDSKRLVPAMIQEKVEETKDIVIKNRKSLHKLFGFISTLCKEYKYEPDRLGNIIRTFLSAIDLAEVKIDKKNFLDEIAGVLESDIWQEYKKFKTEAIFNFINNPIVNIKLRDALIKRFIAALSSEEIVKDLPRAIDIFKNLSATEAISESFAKEIRTILEESYFNYADIMVIASNLDLQKKYISTQTFSKYLSGLNVENLSQHLPVLMTYKNYIEENGLSDSLVTSLTELLKKDKANVANLNENKERIFESLSQLASAPNNIFQSSQEVTMNTLATEIVSVIRQNNIDDRALVIPLLMQLHEVAVDPILAELKSQIASFIGSSSFEKLSELHNTLRSVGILEIFSNQFVEHIATRAVQKGAHEVEEYYKSMSIDSQKIFVNLLISRSPNLGLPFLKEHGELPDRVHNLEVFLTRVEQLASNSIRMEYYDWIVTQVSKNDEDLSLRNLIISQILSLLKNDHPESQTPGYELLKKASFLNRAEKASISEDLFNWIQDPSKTISSNNRQLLWALVILYPSLPLIKRKEYVILLFNLIERDNRELTEMALGLIVSLKPKWSSFKENYTNLKNYISRMGEGDDKARTIKQLLALKPLTSKSSENEYWNELEEAKRLLEA